MSEINKMISVSVFVGTGECNAKCKHCAGLSHRKYTTNIDGVIDEELICKTLEHCYERGARSLTISSSGEPTLSPKSVTRLLQIVNNYKNRGIVFSTINLYSNGIIIGSDILFCKEYLPAWKRLGLTSVYITVHDVDEKDNAKIYGVDSYPKISDILTRLHRYGLLMRANIVLSKNNISTFEKFSFIVTKLKDIGVDAVSAWPVRGVDDKVDETMIPSKTEMDKIINWSHENSDPSFVIRVLGGEQQTLYATGQKLTLFPNGVLSNTWCSG